MQKIFKGKLRSFMAVMLTFIMIFSLLTQAYAEPQKKPKLSVGKVYSGFEVTSNRYIEEANSDAVVFSHKKTGAKLIFLQNDDNNKVFSIAFRTPPKDNTGVNHILEHSVLCGSKKYPSKDPFFTMNKQSVATYLNAYTASDKTVYPVASRNEKDFFNLMSVYLDAVFYPNIYKNPNIFKQEGWRYEINSKDEDIVYNGVVFNEMKGVYSNPQYMLHDKIDESLFPDSIYKYSPGGKPQEIIDLTREQLIETHEKFYTPSNSYIYLYGDLDILKALEFIDKEYLSNFKKVKVDSSIKLQKPLTKKQDIVGEYPVNNNFDNTNKTYLTSNYVVGSVKDREDILGIYILNEILFGLDNSPLKKALTDAKLGSVAEGYLKVAGIQPVYTIMVEDSDEKLKGEFTKVINDTLNRIIDEGLDEELVELAFNSYLKQVRVSDANDTFKGMNYNAGVLISWLYDEDPTLYLEQGKVIEDIRKKADKDYFEKLIKKYLLDNKHSSTVTLKPKAGLEEENAKIVAEKLKEYKESLSENEIEDLIKDTNNLKTWQQTPDTKEDIEKMPTLSISDLETKIEKVDSSKEIIDEIEVLSRNLYTNDVSYISLYFDTTGVPQDKIRYLHLLSSLLGKVSTEKYDINSLAKLLEKEFAQIEFDTSAYEKYKDDKEYYPKLAVSLSVLDENLPNTFSILDEVLNKSKFNEKDILENTIKKSISNIEYMISTQGHALAINKAMSYVSEKGKYNDLGGLEYYRFLKDLDKDLDAKLEDVGKNLNEVANIVFNKENLLVTHTGSEDSYKKFKDNFTGFTKSINGQKLSKQEYSFDNSVKNEAFAIPSEVQNVAKVYNYKKSGYEFGGEMLVLQNILNEYLIQSIRIEGGAYGGNLLVGEDGQLVFFSFRDPNLKETLEAFDRSSEYLKNFCANISEDEFTNYIIGAMGQFEIPIGPKQTGLNEDIMKISGITYEDREKILEEIKNTTVKDIAKYIDMLEKFKDEGVYCITGNGQKINDNKELFEKIEDALN